jgi:hypothetical protein
MLWRLQFRPKRPVSAERSDDKLFPVVSSLVILVDWPEVILKYSIRDFTADLVTIAHRVPPV